MEDACSFIRDDLWPLGMDPRQFGRECPEVPVVVELTINSARLATVSALRDSLSIPKYEVGQLDPISILLERTTTAR